MQGEDRIEGLCRTVMEIGRMVACAEKPWPVKANHTERLCP